MYVHMDILTYVYMYACIYVHMCIHVHMYICIYVCLYICIHIYTCLVIFAWLHVYIYIGYMCLVICMYAWLHAHWFMLTEMLHVSLMCRLVLIISAIARFFGVESEVRDALADTNDKAAIRTEQYICDRLHSSLQMLKACQSEQHRRLYHALLTAVAPIDDRMIAPCCARLGVKRTKRPIYAAVAHAKEIQALRAAQAAPIGVGSHVTCNAGPGVVVGCGTEDGHGVCDVQLTIDGTQHVVRCSLQVRTCKCNLLISMSLARM